MVFQKGAYSGVVNLFGSKADRNLFCFVLGGMYDALQLHLEGYLCLQSG
jgi:hypothetical protein